MRKILRKGFQKFEIIEWNEIRTDDTLVMFPNKLSAINFLRGFMHDHFNMMTLRSLSLKNIQNTLKDNEVIDHLAWQLMSREIRIAVSSSVILTGGARKSSSGTGKETDSAPVTSEQMEAPIEPEKKPEEKNEKKLESSEVNGVNLDTLGAVINKQGEYHGYEKTDFGYVQTDPTQPGPDYLLLIEDPKKMTDKQKHYMRNIELAKLIREGKIPTHLDEFMKSESKNYRLLPEGKSVYHMNGENGGYNVKLVNSRKLHGYGAGELEVVYSTVTGKLDLSAENMPTINRAGPDKTWGHFKKDVKPYWSYKNTPHDSTSWYRRRRGPGSPDQSDLEKKAVYDNVREKLGKKKP